MWLLTVFCFTHFTPDSLNLTAVNTDAIKNFAGFRFEPRDYGVQCNVLQRCAVEVLPEAFLLGLILREQPQIAHQCCCLQSSSQIPLRKEANDTRFLLWTFKGSSVWQPEYLGWLQRRLPQVCSDVSSVGWKPGFPASPGSAASAELPPVLLLRAAHS